MKSKRQPTPEEQDLLNKIKALQVKKREFVRKMDEIDTEIIFYKEKILFLTGKRREPL